MANNREVSSEEIKIVFWNINSDRRVEIFDQPPYMYTANAFKDYSVHKRFPMIAEGLDYFRKKKNISLFALQEVEDSILPEIIKYFQSKGFAILPAMKYNPTDLAFNFVFAYDPTLYTCVNPPEQIYLTATGKPSPKDRQGIDKKLLMDQHYDSEFERSAQVIELEELSSGKQFVIVNNHFGLTNKHRLQVAEKLCKELADIKKPMVLVGDFNQYDFDNKESVLFKKQIEIFEKHGFKWDSECLQSQEPKGTFVTFPYDITRFLSKTDFSEYDALKVKIDYKAIKDFFVSKIEKYNIPLVSTSLDGVFSKNTNNSSENQTKPSFCKAILFANGERIKPTPTAETIQKLALNSYKKDKCIFPSDHLSVLAKVRL